MRSVLVLRDADEFSRVLIEGGVDVINCPVIRTEPLDDLSELERAIESAGEYDQIMLTSAAAAEVLKRYANKLQTLFRGQVIVLGRSSFDILKSTGLNVDIDDGAANARELLEGGGVERFRKMRVLFVRGERSLRTIPEALKGIAEVDQAVVYRTVDQEITEDMAIRIREKLDAGRIAMACFFSPSGVESFHRQAGLEHLAKTAIAAIGSTTAESIMRHGMAVDLISSNPEGRRFAREVLDHMKASGGGID